MELREALAWRQSCRSFTIDQITDEQLDRLLEAAGAAPVALSRFDRMLLTVIQDHDVIDTIDKRALRRGGRFRDLPLHGAPTVIAVSAAETEYEAMYWASASCIAENIMLEAAELGLGSCCIMSAVVAVRHKKDIQDLLELPRGYLPYIMVAVGTPTDAQQPRELSKDKIETRIMR